MLSPEHETRMVTIRNFSVEDSEKVGLLIADTYAEFNLAFATPVELNRYLGPFRHARSQEEEHRQAILQVLESPTFLVAEVDGKLTGILRGRPERLASLFVHRDFHRQGIGRRLVDHFEADSTAEGVSVIRLASTLYAIPFYLKLGYKKSTGVRSGWSFDGHGFRYQPMKKLLSRADMRND